MAEAVRRIPILLATPARVRWLSCEPLLEALDLTPWLPSLDWVVVGVKARKDRMLPVRWIWAGCVRCAAQCAVALTAEEWSVLAKLGRSTKAEVRMRDRARIVLLAAEGVATREIGRIVGCTTGSTA